MSAHAEILNQHEIFSEIFFESDPELGFHFIPNKKIKIQIPRENEPPFTYEFSIDQNGQRKSFSDTKQKKEGAFLFFGDRRVFGEGLSDGETIPSIFSKNTEYRSYNFATRTSGPTHFFVLSKKKYDFVKENNGVAAYFFSPIQLRQLTKRWLEKNFRSPQISKINRELVQNGLMKDLPRYLITIFTWLRWKLGQYQFTLPLITSSDYYFACELFGVSKNQLLQNYPGIKFYFVLTPPGEFPKYFKQCLVEKDISIVDLSEIPLRPDAGKIFSDNFHFTSYGNFILARDFWRAVKEK